eukprot:c41706_g1_i1 orf=271-777(+)
MAFRHQKTVETVETQGTWCCISRPLASSPSYKTTSTKVSKIYKKAHKPEEKGTQHRCGDERSKAASPAWSVTKPVLNKLEKLKKSGEIEKGAGDLLKNGEITALIKQGFIGAGTLDKLDSGLPFRSFLASSGRVSPMVEASALPLSSASARSFDSSSNIRAFSQASPP